ncbi:MAG TPA: DUF4102 domain-containing protein [Candidatus Tenderia sp.]|nr:DUF4102 domain-containing protein [Candidatus Tenderia sp.]
MPLTDTAIKKAKPKGKQYKLFDERGLFLILTPKGGKWWRFKYRFDGKEKLLSLGTYPDVSLKQARDRRDEARKQVAAGIDPGEHRKARKAAKVAKQANSFEVVAREWYAKHAPNWSANHGERIIRRLERDIFPWLGDKPIAEITAPQLLAVVRRIEERGALETAHRALGNCGQVFRYAVATGRAEREPTSDLKGALPPVKGTHFAAVTDPKKVGGVLRAIDTYEGTLIVRCALRLPPLVFLRHAEWKDIDLDAAEWCYTVSKTDTQHIFPLSRQAVEILQELQPLTGRGRYVFPSARNPKGDRPMSNNAILSAMRRMGIEKDEMSGHGFRAMARTIVGGLPRQAESWCGDCPDKPQISRELIWTHAVRPQGAHQGWCASKRLNEASGEPHGGG